MAQTLSPDRTPSNSVPSGDLLLSEFFDRMSEKAYAIDSRYTIVAFNEAAEAYFGFRREAVLGRDAREVFPTGPGSPFGAAIERVMAGEPSVEFEAPSVVVSGVVARGRVFRLSGGGAGLIWSDVTRERELRARLGAREAALTTSETRLALAVDAARLGDFSWDAEADLTELSPRAAEIVGWPVERPISRDVLRSLFHPDDRARVAAEARAAFEEKRSFELEYRIRRAADGAEIWVVSRGRGVYDSQGRLLGLLGVVGDITARKEAEQRLALSEARLRFALDAAHLGEWSWDFASDVVELSPRAAEIIGDPQAASLTREDLRRIYDPRDRDRVFAEGEAAMAERRSFEIEYRIRRLGDGRESWLVSLGRGVYDPDGRMVGQIGVIGDITARKEAELRLAESEARLRLAMDGASLGEYAADLDDGVLRLSPRAAEILGWPAASIARAELHRMIPAEDLPQTQVAIEAARREAGVFDIEYRVRPEGGPERWVASRGRVLPDHRTTVGVLADVTAQKRNEAELRAERERLAEVERLQSFLLRLTDALRDLADPAEVMRTASRMLCEHLNATRAGYLEVDETGAFIDIDPDRISHTPAIVGRRPLDAYGPGAAAELRAGRTVAVADVLSDPRTAGPEAKATLAAVPLRAYLTAPLVKHGRLSGLLFVHDREPRAWSNVDQALIQAVAERTWAALERARVEEALRRKETILRLAVTAGRLVAWEYDADTDETLHSENAREVLGVPGPDGKYLSLLEPEEQERFLAANLRTLETGEPCDVTYRQPAPGGGILWVNSRAVLHTEGGHRRLIGVAVDVTERKRAEELLREQADRADAGRVQAERVRERFWDLSRDLFVIADNEGRVRQLNGPAWEAVLGWPEEVLLVTPLTELVHPDDLEATLELGRLVGTGRPVYGFENRYRHADGGWRWLSWNTVAEGGLNYAVARDVTEEKAREARAMRSQKLEALGRLTGGVAHDFNNLLTAIIGSLDMIQKRPADAARREKLIAAALTAARRGEGLNKQLLGFARRQAVNTEYVRPDRFIADLRPLLEGAVGDVVRLRLELRSGELGARIDPAQFEAALLNLVVNARDAMPSGGQVTVATRHAPPAEVERLGLRPGDYLLVKVRDTGVGMTPDVLAQVFEPFFTTKEVGKGTGLGLSQVYGFARQSGGVADVTSAPGEGATVAVFLPVAEPDAAAPAPPPEEAEAVTRALRVLLAEDDALVGAITDGMLADLGCRVTRAENAAEALRKLDDDVFDLLLTDVRMPGGVNGAQLAAEAVRRRPGLKVLLCSGWTADALGDELQGTRWPLLPKPFDAARLEAAINEAVAPD